MSKYTVHKAVEFDKVTKTALKAMSIRYDRVIGGVDDLSDLWMLQRKYDGCNGVLKLMGNGEDFRSRTDELVRSCEHIARFCKGVVGKDYVLLGEVWHRKWEQPQISGAFRRHSPCPELRFAVFDMLTLAEFEAGKSERPFKQRLEKLYAKLGRASVTDPAFVAATYNEGTYGAASAMAQLLAGIRPDRYDGAILRDPDGLWTAGSGTTGEIIKVKPRPTYDVRVLGVVEGLGKNAGTVGALRCQGPKGEFTVRGCVTDALAGAWWANPDLIIGALIEVSCLEITAAGSLREPVMLRVRDDKTEADF